MTLRQIIPALSAASLLLAAGGCADRMPAWSQFVAFPSGEWTPGIPVEMDPWPLDSVIIPGGRYTLSVCLRYTLPTQRMAEIVVEQDAPGISFRRDTLRIGLLDKAGRPLGHGSYGIYTVECPVPAAPALTEGYSVALHPVSTLTSVSEAGLVLSPPPIRKP